MNRIQNSLLALLATTFLSGGAIAQDIEGYLNRMSLRQQVMQMHTIGFPGTAISPEMKRLLVEEGLGGVFVQVLVNFTFPEELAQLTRAIQLTGLEGDLGLPLFIAMDEEGGVAAPLHYMLGATPTPGNMALGASGRPEDAYAAYATLGAEMAACGANLNYAPAIDVLTSAANPDYTVRSFSGDARLNGVLAEAAVKGLQEERVIACAKHFPGLAWYTEDTHKSLPILDANEAKLWEDDLAQFRGAIAGGCDMIMTCHVLVKAWDPVFPVTCSRTILQEILRGKLGYEGVIITDSMGMGAIDHYRLDVPEDYNYTFEEAAVLAVRAGCDRVLQVSRDTDRLARQVDAIVTAVEKGEIPRAQIEESVRRSLRLKVKYGLFNRDLLPAPAPAEPRLRSEARLRANQQAALNGIVPVRDEEGWLPLSPAEEKLLVICPPTSITRAGKGAELMPVGYSLGWFVKQHCPEAREVFVDTVPTRKQEEHALQAAAEAEVIVLGQLLALQSREQVTFIKRLLALGKKTVIINMGVASDLDLFPEAPAFIAANSPAPISQEAAVKVIFGKAEAGGRLPMPVGRRYPIGYPAPASAQLEEEPVE